jgi:Tol biopolymer transport system component
MARSTGRVPLLLGAIAILFLAATTSRLHAASGVEARDTGADIQGVVLFTSSDGVADDIVAANADGTGERNLTPDHAGKLGDPYDDYAVVSPDGTKIAFDRLDGTRGGVYVMDVDGTHRFRVGNGGFPVWSPDSERLASCGDGVSVLSLDGSNDVLVASSTNFGCSWSPDGTSLAYGTDAGLHVVSADGARNSTIARVSGVWRPAWSHRRQHDRV